MSNVLEGKMTDKKLRFFENFVIGSAERSSTTERQAEEAERTVDAQKQTEYMNTKIGEVFEGTVSGVIPNGFFVELDNTIEGFVSVDRLPKGHYEYNEDRYSISGVGKVYKIGDRISIRVVSTDLVLRHIDFELSDFHREPDEREKEELFSAREYKKQRQHDDFKRHNNDKHYRKKNRRK